MMIQQKLIEHMKKKFIGKVFEEPLKNFDGLVHYIIVDITYGLSFDSEQQVYTIHWKFFKPPADYFGSAAEKIQTLYNVECEYKNIS